MKMKKYFKHNMWKPFFFNMNWSFFINEMKIEFEFMQQIRIFDEIYYKDCEDE